MVIVGPKIRPAKAFRRRMSSTTSYITSKFDLKSKVRQVSNTSNTYVSDTEFDSSTVTGRKNTTTRGNLNLNSSFEQSTRLHAILKSIQNKNNKNKNFKRNSTDGGTKTSQLETSTAAPVSTLWKREEGPSSTSISKDRNSEISKIESLSKFSTLNPRNQASTSRFKPNSSVSTTYIRKSQSMNSGSTRPSVSVSSGTRASVFNVVPGRISKMVRPKISTVEDLANKNKKWNIDTSGVGTHVKHRDLQNLKKSKTTFDNDAFEPARLRPPVNVDSPYRGRSPQRNSSFAQNRERFELEHGGTSAPRPSRFTTFGSNPMAESRSTTVGPTKFEKARENYELEHGDRLPPPRKSIMPNLSYFQR